MKNVSFGTSRVCVGVMRHRAKPLGRLDSVEWNGGMDWTGTLDWNSRMDWNGMVTSVINHLYIKTTF